MVATPRYDLLTFGETMVRLSAPRGVRLEEADTLELTIGGSESNVAVALARLGRSVAWISALPENPLGRRIETELRARGVDTSLVRWSSGGRVGVYFLDPGVEPRPTRVYYDRAGSAVAEIDPGSVDAGLVGAARCLHLTGITPALSAGCANVCERLAREAAEAGIPIVFDVNYRARLWSPEAARAGIEPLVRRAALLLCGANDAETIWGLRGSPDIVARQLQERSGAETVALTLGAEGALVRRRDGTTARHAAVAAAIVDPVGAGDAFAAGFLHCWLEDRSDISSALRSGIALAALKMTVYGDHASVTANELSEAIAQLERPGADIQR